MPIIHVTLVEGRTPEQIQDFAAAITQAALTTLYAPSHSVRVVINSVIPQHYYVAGQRYDRRDAATDHPASERTTHEE